MPPQVAPPVSGLLLPATRRGRHSLERPRYPLPHQLRHRRASSRRGVISRSHGTWRVGIAAAAKLAEELAAGMDAATVEMCKAAALERFELDAEWGLRT